MTARSGSGSRRLGALDAAFLYMDNSTTHMHVASTALFDPATMPGGYTFAKVRALVASRLPRLPPFRRRFREVPLQFHRPVWVDDADFDLDYHVRRASLPVPGAAAQLADLAADLFSRPLDRRRPLWELHVVEGVQDGLFAVILKMHHAVVDGVAGLELAANLLDISPGGEGAGAGGAPWKPEPSPGELELVAEAAVDLPNRARSAWQAVLRATGDVAGRGRHEGPARAPGPAGAAEPAAPGPAPARLFRAPRTSLNVAISAQRRFAFTDVSLESVRSVRAAFGTTINDVVVAGCAGALRRFLSARGELPAEPLVAMVPISLHAGEDLESGNQVSAMLVRLPTDCADPVRRLRRVAQVTRAAKGAPWAAGPADWAELIAPPVTARAARWLASPLLMARLGPIFNVTVSNVPGPDVPLYLAGARLVDLYPMGPIVDGVALNITVMSYLDRLHVGLVGCREAVPDLAELSYAVDDAFVELFEAASRRMRARSRREKARRWEAERAGEGGGPAQDSLGVDSGGEHGVVGPATAPAGTP